MAQDAYMFMKIDGVTGEAHDAAHDKEIEVLEFGWDMLQGSSNQVGANLANNGKVAVKNLTFRHYVDSASPVLMLKCMQGANLDTATLTLCKTADNKAVDYFKVIMSNVSVASVKTGGSNGAGARVDEHVELHFSKVRVEYQGAASGSAPIAFTWDVKRSEEA